VSAGQTFDVGINLDDAQLAAGEYGLRYTTLYYPVGPRGSAKLEMRFGVRR
jgi:hypothetical protein